MTCKQIKEFLDKEAGFNIADKCRNIEYIEYRWAYFYLAFKFSTEQLTYKHVGRQVNRDHATVLYGTKTLKDYYHTDKTFRAFINALKSKIEPLIPVNHIQSFEVIDNMSNVMLKRNLKNMKIENRRLKIKLQKAS